MPQQQKKQLRTQLAAEQAALSEAYIQASDAGIRQQLQAVLARHPAETVFCYVSVGREPGTRWLLEKLLVQGKRVCVPRTLGAGVMEARKIHTMEQLHPVAYGLLEPDESAPLVPPEELELVILPCISCDEQGGRLGHGGGYYDRYLTGVHCPTVCLCRHALLQKTLPREPFDRMVDIVVTEEGLYPKAK